MGLTYTKRSVPTFKLLNPAKRQGNIKAIKAVIFPIDTNYYFFVSDKNNKLYFTKTNTEHEKMISKLQNEGLWLEW